MIERTMTLARRIPLALLTAVLGGLIVAGTLLVWGTRLLSSERGYRYGVGQIALAAGVTLTMISARRADDEFEETRYLAFAAAAALVALGATLSFWWTTIGSVDEVAVGSLLASFYHLPRVGAGAGWYLTLFASAGALAVVTRRLIDRTMDRPSVPHVLHWPVQPTSVARER